MGDQEMRDEQKINIRYVNTGRNHIHVDSQRPEIGAENKELNEAIQCLKKSGSAEKLRNLFSSLFGNLVKYTNLRDRLVCYRGLDKNHAVNGKKIGPNPRCDSEGRYHQKGQKALYMIESPNFLSDELGTDEYVIQEYLLVPSQLNLADLRSENRVTPNLVSYAFSIAESGIDAEGLNIESVFENSNRSRYSYSQLLSNLLMEAGWNGLYVPGVHGNKKEKYNNIVVLGESVDMWEQWAQGDWREKNTQ
jgi:hypothetical protein